MKTLQSGIKYFGASVKGPLHKRENRPNEDAWLCTSGAFGTLIAVSDGMGSKPNARTGSQMACKAVKAALISWVKAPNASPTVLLKLIHLLWGLRVLPASEEDSAATCLFAVVVPSGQLLIAKLGDGMAAIREADGKITVLGNEREGFSNQTIALGVAKSLKEWDILTKPSLSPGAAILLATDGIADDLIAERLGEFFRILTEHFGAMAAAKRQQSLWQELRNWPTPKHLDDKTLAIIWRKKDDCEEEN